MTDYIQKVYRYVIKATDEQKTLFDQWNSNCVFLYNLALEQRVVAYKTGEVVPLLELANRDKSIEIEDTNPAERISLSTVAQSREFTELRAKDDRSSAVARCCQTEVLRDLDKTYANFFRRIKNKEKVSSPRFRTGHKFYRLSFPRNASCPSIIQEGKKTFLKTKKAVGLLELSYSRPIPEYATLRSASIIKEGKYYFACLLVREPKDKQKVANKSGSIGIDMGVSTSVTTSDGESFSIPKKRIKELLKRKAFLQRKQARKIGAKKGQEKSRRWRVLHNKITKIDKKIRQIRKNFNHQLSKQLVDRYSKIVLEDLKIKNMTKSAKGTIENPGTNVSAKRGLNREILNQAWGQFRQYLTYKGEWYDTEVRVVCPKNTSRTCSSCGHISADNRKTQAKFECIQCGFAANADYNASVNILKRGEKVDI